MRSWKNKKKKFPKKKKRMTDQKIKIDSDV